MAEADSLLTVSAGASADRMRNAPAARAMLHTLHTETSIFMTKEAPPERYLFILVRDQKGKIILYCKTVNLCSSSMSSRVKQMFVVFLNTL